MFKKLITISSLLFSFATTAQIGIGVQTPHNSAILDVHSESKGFLIPRMSTSDRTGINGGNYAPGLIIYNTDDKCINFYNGSSWINPCVSGSSGPLPLPDFNTSNCYTPPSAVANDRFGNDVDFSTDGSRLIVGSYWDDSKKGSAYIYHNDGSGWVVEQQIFPPSASNNDLFGTSTQISGDGSTVVVGAIHANTKGEAYVYTRTGTTWTLQATLTPPVSENVREFGITSITPDGNTIVIGAYSGTLASIPGKGFVYKRTGTSWSQTQILNSGTSGADDFGSSVRISADGNVLVIGAQYQSTMGAAYIYTFDSQNQNWVQTQSITASDISADDYYGSSVTLSADGGTIVVGAIGNDNWKGAAYVYTRNGNTWGNEVKLVPADVADDDNFGIYSSISNDGTALIVSAFGDFGLGYAYVYEYDGTDWNVHKKLSEAGYSGSWYGISADIAPNKSKISVGAMLHSSSTGSVCIYE
ncbi:MAG: hypothetical protein ACPG6V_11420 [Flavobacteriales bacterium]